MVEHKKIADLHDFEGAPYLDGAVAIAAYLTDILGATDGAMLPSALGDIARLRGISEVANLAGVSREIIVEELSPGGAPSFDTVNRVCSALGVRLVVQPVHG